jgi:hypothetical protein
VVRLWNAAGVLIGTATAVNETASGWQSVPFAQPVAITAGSEYRATYYAPTGHYAVDVNALAAAITNGPLSTVPSGGTYIYGTGMPTGTAPHKYWVDVTFVAAAP